MTDARRPLKSRSTAWAWALARALTATPITPNQISVLSIVFATIGAAAIAKWPSPVTFVFCALCVQLRLLCNLLDGMVAVEGKKGTATGVLYNEVPDRIADSVFLVALGYAAGLGWVGWLAALLAAFTAYIRLLGGSLGYPQDFRGPQAKPHRMAVMTLGLILAAIEQSWLATTMVLPTTLAVIVLGSALTCVLRLMSIASKLSGGAPHSL